MNVPVQRIREDFDRIALLNEQHGGARDFYHRYLLERLPRRRGRALEMGCGTGEFTRLLATRSGSVVAVDLSPQMIRVAEEKSSDCPNVEYVLGDVMRLPLPAEEFDCVVSLATLHHLPLQEALSKMKAALKPGGTLIIHDLVADEGPADTIRSALAYAVSGTHRLWKTGRPRAPRDVRDAWAEHARDEVYLKLSEVREMCERHLPGAQIRRHLLWRYTVVWRKPGAP